MPAIGATIKEAIAVIVITIALLAMTPTVVDTVQDMNTTGWSFTGYQGAIQFLGLVPFIWVASILTACALGMFSIYKGGKGG